MRRRRGGETDQVPETVLRELQTAFGLPADGTDDADPSGSGIDFDDPDVDALLGLTDPSATSPTPAPSPAPEVVEQEAPVPAARATIVIGGDDELPDPLYLDDVAAERSREEAKTERMREVHGAADAEAGALSTTGSGGTIVIGDELDSSGAFDAVAPPSRSMDPRVRARRDAVKRSKLKKRLIWAGALLVVVILAVGAVAVFASSLFAVETVRIQGAAYTEAYDGAALQAVVDELTGEPILLVDTLAAEEALEQIAWVERAIVTTDFPHTVMIDIRERQPLASFQGSDGRFRIIDRDGRVLDVLDGRPADYMLIAGQAPDADRGTLAGAPFAAAAQMVAALPAEIREITTAAGVDAATGDLSLLLQPAVEVRIGSFTDMDSKLARLLQVIRDGLLGIVKVDVSTGEVSVTRG